MSSTSRLVSSLACRGASSLRRSSVTAALRTSGAVRTFAIAPPAPSEGSVPDSLKRIGKTEVIPNEYPGQIYAFNWCLNGDGVTPINKSAFRISKPLDLKVAGLTVPPKMPLAVKPAPASKIPEAGAGDALTFTAFDENSQSIRDRLSLSPSLYCPEGCVPGTRTAVRVITNSKTLAPQMLAYLERTPRLDPPQSLPITVYALEGDKTEFAGYAIEEIEVEVPLTEPRPKYHAVHDMETDIPMEAKSVAAIVVASTKTPDIKVLVAGIELSQKALAADELERQAKKDAEEAKE